MSEKKFNYKRKFKNAQNDSSNERSDHQTNKKPRSDSIIFNGGTTDEWMIAQEELISEFKSKAIYNWVVEGVGLQDLSLFAPDFRQRMMFTVQNRYDDALTRARVARRAAYDATPALPYAVLHLPVPVVPSGGIIPALTDDLLAEAANIEAAAECVGLLVTSTTPNDALKALIPANIYAEMSSQYLRDESNYDKLKESQQKLIKAASHIFHYRLGANCKDVMAEHLRNENYPLAYRALNRYYLSRGVSSMTKYQEKANTAIMGPNEHLETYFARMKRIFRTIIVIGKLREQSHLPPENWVINMDHVHHECWDTPDIEITTAGRTCQLNEAMRISYVFNGIKNQSTKHFAEPLSKFNMEKNQTIRLLAETLVIYENSLAASRSKIPPPINKALTAAGGGNNSKQKSLTKTKEAPSDDAGNSKTTTGSSALMRPPCGYCMTNDRAKQAPTHSEFNCTYKLKAEKAKLQAELKTITQNKVTIAPATQQLSTHAIQANAERNLKNSMEANEASNVAKAFIQAIGYIANGTGSSTSLNQKDDNDDE
jgi:hypothetical protein